MIWRDGSTSTSWPHPHAQQGSMRRSVVMHELWRAQILPDHICILVVYDQRLWDTCLHPSHLPQPPLASHWIRGLSSVALPASVVQVPRPTISQLPSYFEVGLALPSPHPLLLTPLSPSPSDILHVVVHSDSIFPCFIAHNTCCSLLSGGGNQSPYAKHHSPSSIRDNQSRRPRRALHSTDSG